MPDNGMADPALRVRVDTLAEDMRGFHVDLRDVRSKMATRDDIVAIAAQITALATRQETGSKPNWQMWGVAVTVLGLLGAVMYWPINRDTGRLDIAVAAIVDKGVFQRQYDAERSRLNEGIKQLDEQIQFIRRSFVRSDDSDKQLAALKILLDRNTSEIALLRERSYQEQLRLSKLEEANRINELHKTN